MSKNPQEHSAVQVIARAAQILRVVADHSGMSLAEIAAEVGLARSTVHRIVSSLVRERLVSDNGPGEYRLGPEISNLAEARKAASLRDLHPFLVRLSRTVNETVELSIRAGSMVTFVDQVVAPQLLRAVSAHGLAFPLHCTANGKAVLAALRDDVARSMLEGRLESFTANTITNSDLLAKELAEIRAAGIAFDREEFSIGICAVSSALMTSDGDVAAISIPMPAERFYGQEERLSRELLRTMAEIQRALPAFCLPSQSNQA